MIFYDDVIKVSLNQSTNNIYINGQPFVDKKHLPHGIEIIYPSQNVIVVEAKDSNYEVESDILNKEITIRAPSHMYGSKLEGLCGDCNDNSDDDSKLTSGEIVFNEITWITSWIIYDYDRDAVIFKNVTNTNTNETLLSSPSVPEISTDMSTTEQSGYDSENCVKKKERCTLLQGAIFQKVGYINLRS